MKINRRPIVVHFYTYDVMYSTDALRVVLAKFWGPSHPISWQLLAIGCLFTRSSDGAVIVPIDRRVQPWAVFYVTSLYVTSLDVCHSSRNPCVWRIGLFASARHVDLGMYLDGWPPGKTGRCEPVSVNRFGLKSVTDRLYIQPLSCWHGSTLSQTKPTA